MTPLATAAAPILRAAQLAAETARRCWPLTGVAAAASLHWRNFWRGSLAAGWCIPMISICRLPCAARTGSSSPARIDFIRLRNEVLQPLLRGEAALYNAYSCAAGAFLPSKLFAAAPLTILEGSYSLHPALQTDFAVRVFVTCPPDVQAARCGRERVYVTQILCSGGSRWRKGICCP